MLAVSVVVQALAMALPAAGLAQTVEDLRHLSIEDLANIEVTSVSRRPEPLNRAPAAVYVITAEDIHRSGANSIPEALRLAPNLTVARLNAYNYTVTARGFNSPESANKLLVLVDGRSVYSPLAATVFWESVDVALADVERIEVVSGPGGTLWGANAVNGVINIITRHTRDTQGLMVETGVGNLDRHGTVRYGGRLGDRGTYRIYATGFDRPSTDRVARDDITTDAFHGVQGGFRMDLAREDDAYTLQGDLYRNETAYLDMSLYGGNMLGRWTRRLGAGSSLHLQAYYDRKVRDYFVAKDTLETYDIQAQHNIKLGRNHNFVWGGGYRLWRSVFVSKSVFHFADPTATPSVGSIFAQDEIALRPDLMLTLGLKIENSSYTGIDYLPNLRLAWQLNDDHLLWAAVSRAVRTPSRIDRELEAPVILVPSPGFRAEELTAYEIGYRGQPTPRTSLSVSAFYNVYDDLRTTGSTAGRLPLMLRNDLAGETYGMESWGSYDVNDRWRLHAGVSWLHKDLRLEPGTDDISNMQAAGQDPVYQVQLRSEMDLAPGLELDLRL
ncbi:MAG TPA: TonB-dependent receptor, partial [Arenibaculum sp.]|nr:TonB-dependent receptor [Arenibaculum sp.]